MMLGIYSSYLSAISNLNLYVLIPIAIGIAIGGFIFLCLIEFLFKYFKSYTYFLIIGFVLGSIFVIYPGFSFNLECVISIVLFVLSYLFARKINV